MLQEIDWMRIHYVRIESYPGFGCSGISHYRACMEGDNDMTIASHLQGFEKSIY